jgi:hypothetical protein
MQNVNLYIIKRTLNLPNKSPSPAQNFDEDKVSSAAQFIFLNSLKRMGYKQIEGRKVIGPRTAKT